MRILVLAIFLLLSGCYKGHLYVQQEWVDANFLASSRINTPDPRKAKPPCGQRLLIRWIFPTRLFTQNLFFHIRVRFWDGREQVIDQAIPKRLGDTAFFFTSSILTYRVEVLNGEGELVDTWEHHFWTEWIDMDHSLNH